MKIENLKNIQALLLKGKWELTAQESVILVNLVNTVGEEIKKLEEEAKNGALAGKPEEPKSE